MRAFLSIIFSLVPVGQAFGQSSDAHTSHSYNAAVDKVLQGHVLSATDLNEVGCDDLWILRWWPLARSGIVFKNDKLQARLVQDSRYQPTPAAADEAVRLATETDNQNQLFVSDAYNQRCPPEQGQPAPADMPAADSSAPPTCLPPPSCKTECAAWAFEWLMSEIVEGGMLVPSRLKGVECNQLRLLKLATLAIHGYAFQDPRDAAFFANYPWYVYDEKMDDAAVKKAIDVRGMVNLRRLEDARRSGKCPR